MKKMYLSYLHLKFFEVIHYFKLQGLCDKLHRFLVFVDNGDVALQFILQLYAMLFILFDDLLQLIILLLLVLQF